MEAYVGARDTERGILKIAKLVCGDPLLLGHDEFLVCDVGSACVRVFFHPLDNVPHCNLNKLVNKTSVTEIITSLTFFKLLISLHGHVDVRVAGEIVEEVTNVLFQFPREVLIRIFREL